MNPTRKILASAAAIGVALVVLVLYLLTNLDAIVKREIERYGTRITGTTVSIESVEISPTSGDGTIRGLRIANPPGFAAGSAFELEEIQLKIDPSTLTGNPVVVEKVIVVSPKLHYAMNGLGKSNVGSILDNVKRSGSQDATSTASNSANAANSTGSDKTRIAIRYLSFQGGEMDASSHLLGGQSFEASLPGLTMHAIGGARGASPAAVGSEILAAYGAKVAIVVATKALEKTVKSQVKQATDLLPGSTGKALGGVIDDVFKLLPGGED
ncbi:MAG: hypothetical protein VCC68_01145 [Myxococcota bacterium]